MNGSQVQEPYLNIINGQSDGVPVAAYPIKVRLAAVSIRYACRPAPCALCLTTRMLRLIFFVVFGDPPLLHFHRSSNILKNFILAYEYLLLVAQEKYVQVCLIPVWW